MQQTQQSGKRKKNKMQFTVQKGPCEDSQNDEKWLEFRTLKILEILQMIQTLEFFKFLLKIYNRG